MRSQRNIGPLKMTAANKAAFQSGLGARMIDTLLTAHALLERVDGLVVDVEARAEVVEELAVVFLGLLLSLCGRLNFVHRSFLAL